MAKKKIGIGTIEINKKFVDFNEASKYAKRLRSFINYTCKKNNYQASVMTVVSNLKKEVSKSRYIHNGKRGRPKRELVINEMVANNWYKGNYHTDWHIHILIVSKPSFTLRNLIKDYVDKNWCEIPNIYEKEKFDISKFGKKKVYKKTCNIKIADYFIDQSAEIRFVNCNCSKEKDFDYSLKDYYREYMKSYSNKIKLINKQRLKPMSEEKYLKKLEKIESPFKIIEDYFYSITKEQEEKEQKEYMEKVRLYKISENYNKVQNISIRDRFEETYY